MATTDVIKIALLQLKVTEDKQKTVEHAIQQIREVVKAKQPKVIALAECFNCPYGNEYFDKFSESIPDGYTCQQLSSVAKELGIYIIGGSIIEKDVDGKLYNTSTIWCPEGKLIGKHRKVHLFDVDIKGKITFQESATLTPGSDFTIVTIENHKFGIFICNDIRFEEFARAHRNEGCEVLVIPSAFDANILGPPYWNLFARVRAVDNQVYLASISPARDVNASYVAYGHTIFVDPWGNIVYEAKEKEEVVVFEIDFNEIRKVREQFIKNRRTDLYETIKKK